MPLYFGRPISAPLPCPAQALTSPSLSLQEVRLIDRGEEQAAPPSRAWVCAPRAARARNSCQKSSTRWAHACAADQATFALRGARTTSPRRRRWIPRGAGRLCLPSARAHCPELRAETGHVVLIHCTHLAHAQARGAMSLVAPATLHEHIILPPR